LKFPCQSPPGDTRIKSGYDDKEQMTMPERRSGKP
jgi:hypothetical protein